VPSILQCVGIYIRVACRKTDITVQGIFFIVEFRDRSLEDLLERYELYKSDQGRIFVCTVTYLQYTIANRFQDSRRYFSECYAAN